MITLTSLLCYLFHLLVLAHLPPCAVPHYTARSAESSTVLFQYQRSALLAHHRRSDGSIAGTLPQMLSAAFEIGVVGLHLNDAAMLVKINHGCLLLFGKPCSHKTS